MGASNAPTVKPAEGLRLGLGLQGSKNREMHDMTYKHLAALRDHVEAFIKDRLESHEMTVNSYESTVSPTHARSYTFPPPCTHTCTHPRANVRFISTGMSTGTACTSAFGQ